MKDTGTTWTPFTDEPMVRVRASELARLRRIETQFNGQAALRARRAYADINAVRPADREDEAA